VRQRRDIEPPLAPAGADLQSVPTINKATEAVMREDLEQMYSRKSIRNYR